MDNTSCAFDNVEAKDDRADILDWKWKWHLLFFDYNGFELRCRKVAVDYEYDFDWSEQAGPGLLQSGSVFLFQHNLTA